MTEGTPLSSDFKQVLPQVSASPKGHRGSGTRVTGLSWKDVPVPAGSEGGPRGPLFREHVTARPGSSARGQQGAWPAGLNSRENAGDVQRSQLKKRINITTSTRRTTNTR